MPIAIKNKQSVNTLSKSTLKLVSKLGPQNN